MEREFAAIGCSGGPRRGDLSFTSHATSQGRGWNGFDAAISTSTRGFTETPHFPVTTLAMHTSPQSVTATTWFDGRVDRNVVVPGDIDVIPAGYSGAWYQNGPAAALIVHLTPALLRVAAEEIGVDPARTSVAPQLRLNEPRIVHLCWAIVAELNDDDPLGHLFADSLGLALATQLLRGHAREGAGVPRPALRRRMQPALDYIAAHVASDLSLAELAAVANLSPTHFAKLFKELTGCPVHQYVVRARVDRAITLLVRDRDNLADVALQVGFADQSHMARCMRRVTGLSPSVVARESRSRRDRWSSPRPA